MDATDPTGQYELTFEARKGYLYAYVCGDHDAFEISTAYWGEIAHALKDRQIDKLPFVEDIVEQSPVADINI